MAPSRIAELVGRVLGGRYRLTRPLGTGSSAHVYVADDVTLRRRVAVKVLHPALAGDEAFLRRFQAEARVVASLRSPHILRVYDWGEDGGSPYLVMELLAGGSLRSLLDSGYLLSPAQAALVGADAARALDYAHRRGLVHRDIKPANLLFDDEGRVSVADFGLARALAEATWTEPSGAVVGTARYAAPEQVRGDPLDSKADVYALALVLVEAITGIVPFALDTTLGTLMARVQRSLRVSGPLDGLGPILEAAGTVDPVDRLDAGGLARALDALAGKLPPPQTLPPSGPLVTGAVEPDRFPTRLPDRRPQLFDMDAVDTGTVDTDTADTDTEDAVVDVDGRVVVDVDGSDTHDGHRRGGDKGRFDLPGVGTSFSRRPRRRRRIRLMLAGLMILAVLAGGSVVAVEVWQPFTPSHPVPRLVADTETQATAALAPLHLHLFVVARSYDQAAAGTVLSQTPSSGRLREGRRVSVTMSLGPQPVPVPSLGGGRFTVDQATAVLNSVGLKAGSITQVSSLTAPAGSVVSSAPSGGSLLPGQAVSLVVSTGKPTVAVPALTGTLALSFAAAQTALAGLQLGATETDAYSDTVAKGQVIATTPASGTTVTVGTVVTVTISRGPDLVAVPGLRGDSVGAATNQLTADGLAVSGVTGNPLQTVTATVPAAGALVHRGGAVQIVTG